ncbi:hypothetical protein [Microvirga massiliensis]|uniref:hypothetical protein n=1 Tax=Microvirga massiliensis TaxID=1033741 RepID=UPI00062BCE7C|nr:hypothetical protein [Microvirga massiliensis]
MTGLRFFDRLRVLLAALLLFVSVSVSVSLGMLATILIADVRIWALFCIAAVALAAWMSRELYRLGVDDPAIGAGR